MRERHPLCLDPHRADGIKRKSAEDTAHDMHKYLTFLKTGSDRKDKVPWN